MEDSTNKFEEKAKESANGYSNLIIGLVSGGFSDCYTSEEGQEYLRKFIYNAYLEGYKESINEIASTEIVENFKNLNAEEQSNIFQTLYNILSENDKQAFIDDNIDDASVDARCFTY